MLTTTAMYDGVEEGLPSGAMVKNVLTTLWSKDDADQGPARPKIKERRRKPPWPGEGDWLITEGVSEDYDFSACT